MTTRKLGNSDLGITAIGVGSWAIGGGGWQFAWGAQDDGDSVAAIRAALDKGMNWIDTAAVYGFGHSEEMVGDAIKGLAKRPYIFTKCGRLGRDDGSIFGSLKAVSVRKECEASLRRLKSMSSTSIRCTGPIPKRRLKRPGPRWPNCGRKGKYVGWARRISMSAK